MSAAAKGVEVNQRHVAGWKHLRVGAVGDEPWVPACLRAQDLHASGHFFGAGDEGEKSEETQDDVCRIFRDEDDANEASENRRRDGGGRGVGRCTSPSGTWSFFCCRPLLERRLNVRRHALGQ